jgi:hypothetical protein
MFFAAVLGMLVGAAFVMLVQQWVDDVFAPDGPSERRDFPRPVLGRPRGLDRDRPRGRAA